jgi:hypothetical protein
MRKIACITLFFFLSNIFLPSILYAISDPKPSQENSAEQKSDSSSGFFQRVFRNLRSKAKNFTPDEMQAIIDSSNTKTFEGNPTLRQEESTILRPIKQVSLAVMDDEIGVFRTFLSFQAAQFLKKSFDSVVGRKTLATSRKVVEAMTGKQFRQLNRALGKLGIATYLKSLLKKPSPAVQAFMKTEGKFVAMALIGSMIAMGIYDGLDVNGVKDSILALDPLETNRTVSHGLLSGLLGGMAGRRSYAFFNHRFDFFYDKMLVSKGFGGHLLKILDKKADVVGRKIFKATRLGLKPQVGESFATKLGLVGVGEGVQFTLKGLLRYVSVGVAFGLVTNMVIDGVVVGVRGYKDTAIIGANRDQHAAHPEYNQFLFQRSGSKIKNWVNERKFALMDVFDKYDKMPLTQVFGTVSGFLGAYVGSVVAGAVIAGGGIPAMVGGVMIASLFAGVGSFVGSWATTKLERGPIMKNLRRKLLERTLFKVILKMELHSSGKVDKVEARQLAHDRSWDMYRLEGMGQVYNRIYLVEAFSRIQLYKKRDFVYMKIDERYGQEFNMQAHIRYALVDIDGNEGSWDMVANHVFNLGNIQENNGQRVIFLTDDENVTLEDDLLVSRKGGNFRVLTNGLIMTRSDLDSSRWVIKGQNLNTDVFLRSARKRYAWDTKQDAYKQVLGSANPYAPETQSLRPFLRILTLGNSEKSIQALEEEVRSRVTRNQKKTLNWLEALSVDKEPAFFMALEERGVSRELVENLIQMETSQWKHLLLGKLKRGVPYRMNNLIGNLSKQSQKDLESSLRQELRSPDSATIWDSVMELLDSHALVASFVR